MIRILDIALKDLLQLARDVKTFIFLVFMPVVFTLLFGFAFGGFSSAVRSAPADRLYQPGQSLGQPGIA